MSGRQLPDWIRRARDQWEFDGSQRPPFAVVPGPGQESVWDYPRPPRLERDSRGATVSCGQAVVARAPWVVRVLETASPPTVYLPPDAVVREWFRPAGGGSVCEWKGEAQYWDLATESVELSRVAWSYPDPFPGFEAIAGYFSFYPARLECRLGGELVAPQPGGFYGGWVTREIVGPLKGGADSEVW